MKKLLALALVVLLAGCAAGSLNLTQTQKVLNLAKQVKTQCSVVNPFLVSMKTLQTDPQAIKLLGQVQDKTTEVCSLAAAVVSPPAGTVVTLNLQTVSDYLDKQVPNILTLIQSSGMSDKAKVAAELAVTGVQTALNIAVANAS